MKNRVIHTKHIFSGGVLDLHYEIIPGFTGCAEVSKVNISEYDPQTGDYVLTATYSATPEDNDIAITQDWHGELTYISSDKGAGNNLVKCEFYLAAQECPNPPCCIDEEDGVWKVTEYYVDMTPFKAKLLDNINLQCDSCDVPMSIVSDILKLFSVKAAAETDSPKLESMFSKTACAKGSAVPVAHSSNCNCNG